MISGVMNASIKAAKRSKGKIFKANVLIPVIISLLTLPFSFPLNLFIAAIPTRRLIAELQKTAISSIIPWGSIPIKRNKRPDGYISLKP